MKKKRSRRSPRYSLSVFYKDWDPAVDWRITVAVRRPRVAAKYSLPTQTQELVFRFYRRDAAVRAAGRARAVRRGVRARIHDRLDEKV